MNKKIIGVILFAFLMASPFFSHQAVAQEANQGALQSVLKIFVDNFGFLFRANFFQESNQPFIYLKVLISLVLILPLLFILRKLFGEKNKVISGIMAVVIGLFSVMFIPNQIIAQIGTTYGGVTIAFLFLLPALAVIFFFWFMKKTVESWSETAAAALELITMAAGLGFTVNFQLTIKNLANQYPLLGSFTQNMAYLYAIFGIGLLIALVKLFGGWGRVSDLGSRTLGRMRGTGGAGGGGTMPTINMTAGGTPTAPVISNAETQRASQIMSDIGRADENFLRNINTIKSLAPEELQTLTGIRTALENVAEGIDATKAVYLSALTYKEAAIPNTEKTAGIERINQTLRQNSAQIQEQLNKISEGFAKINIDEGEKGKTLENYERVEGEKVKKQLENLKTMIEEWKAIAGEDIKKNETAIGTIATQLNKMEIPAGKTTANLSSEIASLQKTNENYTKLQAELASLEKNELRKLEESFTNLLRTIAMNHSNIETFKKMITNDTDKISSAIQRISKEGAIEKDFNDASASIRSIANDETPKMEQTLNQTSEAVDVIGGEVAETQKNANNLIGRITQLIEKGI